MSDWPWGLIGAAAVFILLALAGLLYSIDMSSGIPNGNKRKK